MPSTRTSSLLGVDAESVRIETFVQELASRYGSGSGGQPHPNCLTPDVLSEWILEKGEDFGSVYLVPAGAKHLLVTSDQSSLMTGSLTGSAGGFSVTTSYRYSLAVSHFAQQQPRFMTLSCHGMNEFHSTSEVRFVSLDEWLSEFRLYSDMKGLSFFASFKKTKAFQTWKRVVKRQKFSNAKSQLQDASCILGSHDPKMRDAFLQVQALVGKLSDMGVTEILPRKTYQINDFFSRQQDLVSSFGDNFSSFREGICQMVLATCKSTFAANGFSYEDYTVELNWLTYINSLDVGHRRRRSGVPRSENSFTSSSNAIEENNVPAQPRKMTFMEQVCQVGACTWQPQIEEWKTENESDRSKLHQKEELKTCSDELKFQFET